MPLRVMLALLFLSLLSLSPATSYTLFFLEGQIICNRTHPFDYQIHVIENDLFGYKDISRASFVHSPTSSSNYSITGIDVYDPNDYFEIWFMVYHNCQDEGKHMLSYKKVYDFRIKDGTYYDTFDMDLTNNARRYDW